MKSAYIYNTACTKQNKASDSYTYMYDRTIQLNKIISAHTIHSYSPFVLNSVMFFSVRVCYAIYMTALV